MPSVVIPLIVLTAQAGGAGTGNLGVGEPSLLGTWQDETDTKVRLEISERLWVESRQGQAAHVGRILDLNLPQLVLCESGWTRNRTVRAVAEGRLEVKGDETGKSTFFRRISRSAKFPSVAALPLPEPVPLKASEVDRIRRELTRLTRPDRPTQNKPLFAPGQEPADLPWLSPLPDDSPMVVLARRTRLAQNLQDFKELLSKSGWIDVDRFGYGSAQQAVSLVQHSWDIPLMKAALPWVERDARAGKIELEDYGLLYDRLQISLGEKQRYASQIGFDKAGEAVVLPTEDQEGVEARRREMGMEPLDRYVRIVAQVRQALATEGIRFAGECASQAK